MKGMFIYMLNTEVKSAENSKAKENAFAIEIENLEKRYGTKRAVANASFSVKHGEIMGFLGPNGAGKSTTMNIITGYLSPTSGTVKVGGADILKTPSKVKRMIGYLPENPPLYPELTVFEYLNFVYDLKKVKGNKKEHIEDVMRTVKITHVKNRMIKNLSKGYKQRTGLAQALIGDPEVLILDEPTVGLDPKQIIEIRNVIKEIGKKRTVILSTHILQEVSAVCDRVTIINQGRIVVSDTLSGIQEKMGDRGKYIIRTLCTEQTARNILSEVKNIKFSGYIGSKEEGSVDFMVEAAEGEDIRAEIFSAFAAASVPLIGLKSAELSLEEIFIRLTTDAAYAAEEPEELPKKSGFFESIFAKKKKDKKAENKKADDIKDDAKDEIRENKEEIGENIKEITEEKEAKEDESNIQ